MTLRGRIVSLTLGAALALLLLFAIPLLLLEQRAAAHDVQQNAIDAARGVADYVSASTASRNDFEAYVDRVNGRETATPVAVITPDGRRYGPEVPGADEVQAAPASEGNGDSDGDRDGRFLRQSSADVDTVDGGRLVRVEVRTAGGPTTVLAFAPEAEVRSTVTARLLPLLAAAAVLVLVVGVVAELVSRRLVRSLDRTADLADTIAAGDTLARVPDAGPPEVRRVAHALNGLAGRIDELLAAERETAADFSHRLRTPLTALRLDVESLPDTESRRELEDHVDNLERTLTAVIHQARRPEREGARVGCRPAPVVIESVAYWQPLIEDQGRSMDVAVAPDLPEVHCSAEDLRAAIDALIENALAHTPDQTPVAVRASRGDGEPRQVLVDVCDRGPGFHEDAVHRGRSDRGSTGLGLDIARRCARASGGDLAVSREAREPGSSESDGWTVVRLRLGLA